jgi:hypothetical protein
VKTETYPADLLVHRLPNGQIGVDPGCEGGVTLRPGESATAEFAIRVAELEGHAPADWDDPPGRIPCAATITVRRRRWPYRALVWLRRRLQGGRPELRVVKR